MIRYQIPTWIQQLYGGVLWRGNPAQKTIYITFDDGCIPEVTPQVLDMLDEYNAKATFFCVGENVARYPELFAQLRQRGHAVGNHTYNHMQGMRNSIATYVDNAAKADALLQTHLFRPPHGRMRPRQKRILTQKYRIVLWDVLTNDYNRRLAPETILKNVKRHTRNGSIVVFHDSLKAQRNMLAVLPQALAWWSAQGYTFKTLDEGI